jgi:hypothetical protein
MNTQSQSQSTLTIPANSPVVYRNEQYTALGYQGEHWVRITNKNNGEMGFVVWHELLQLVEIQVKTQPESLKKLSPSIEAARSIVKLAVDYQTLYVLLQKSSYLQNDFRAWLAGQNRRGQHFGLLKAITLSKLAKIIRQKLH